MLVNYQADTAGDSGQMRPKRAGVIEEDDRSSSNYTWNSELLVRNYSEVESWDSLSIQIPSGLSYPKENITG